MLDESTIPHLIITRHTMLLLPQKKIVFIGFGHAIRPQQLLATLEPSEGSASRSQARTALVDKPACAVGLTYMTSPSPLAELVIVFIGFGHAIRPQQLLATLEPSEGSAPRSQARTALVD